MNHSKMVLYAVIFLVATLMFSPIGNLVLCAEEYVYYGVVPARIYRYGPKRILHEAIEPSAGWKLDFGTVRKNGLVAVAAPNDNTEVKVYVWKDKKWVFHDKFTLASMEKHFFQLPNGTIFKMVSNNPVSVLLFSALEGEKLPGPETESGIVPQAFYTTPEGSYVGKKFIFVASQTLIGENYHIFALENAKVTITREDGKKQTFTLKANEHKAIPLKAFKVYKVESTGNIMIQSVLPLHIFFGGAAGWYEGRSFYIPSAEGGFVGRRFYTVSTMGFDPKEEHGFRISSLENAKVTIWDLEFQKVIETVEVKAGASVNVKPKAEAIAIESDKPITVAFIHSGSIKSSYKWAYGKGVTFFTVKAGQEVPFYLPTNSSVDVYIFAKEDAQVKIDDVPITIPADTFFHFSNIGFHKIYSDKNLVVQIIHRPLTPKEQGVDEFGTFIPCIDTAGVTAKVKLTPLGGGGMGMSMNYIVAGVVVIVAIVAIYGLTRRRKAG